MTYSPKQRIASSMISTARIGGRSRQARACRHQDGQARGERRLARVDHHPADSISVISTSAVSRVREVSILAICLAAPGVRQARAVAAVLAGRMSKRNLT